jgi:hypothetical protein
MTLVLIIQDVPRYLFRSVKDLRKYTLGVWWEVERQETRLCFLTESRVRGAFRVILSAYRCFADINVYMKLNVTVLCVTVKRCDKCFCRGGLRVVVLPKYSNHQSFTLCVDIAELLDLTKYSILHGI